MPELNRAGIAANDQRLPNLRLTPSISHPCIYLVTTLERYSRVPFHLSSYIAS